MSTYDLEQALRSPYELVLCLLPQHLQQAAEVAFAVRCGPTLA